MTLRDRLSPNKPTRREILEARPKDVYTGVPVEDKDPFQLDHVIEIQVLAHAVMISEIQFFGEISGITCRPRFEAVSPYMSMVVFEEPALWTFTTRGLNQAKRTVFTSWLKAYLRGEIVTLDDCLPKSGDNIATVRKALPKIKAAMKAALPSLENALEMSANRELDIRKGVVEDSETGLDPERGLAEVLLLAKAELRHMIELMISK